jgi:hypothetical protein
MRPVAARGHIYKPPPAAGNGLLNNLIAYWKLDEAGGANNALDAHSGARTLTQNNSPGSATGLVYSTARAFDGYTSRRYFSRTSETALQGGDNDYTIAAWVYLNTVTANQAIITKWVSSVEYYMVYNYNDWSATPYWLFVMDGTSLPATNAGAATVSTWYLVTFWYDAANDTMGISVNNGTPNTQTGVGAGATGTEAFRIGNLAGGAYYPNARIGPLMMWKSTPGNGGVLTSTQRTALYNSGNGLAYASFTT